MSQINAKTKTLGELRACLQALNPEIPVEVADGVTVMLGGVKMRHIEEFFAELTAAMPAITDILGRPGTISMLGDKQAAAGLVMQLLPLIGSRLSGVIDRCVTPAGIYGELEPDQAAPVVAMFIEREILNEGKWKRWMKAFEPLQPQFQKFFPKARTTATISGTSPSASSPTAGAPPGSST